MYLSEKNCDGLLPLARASRLHLPEVQLEQIKSRIDRQIAAVSGCNIEIFSHKLVVLRIPDGWLVFTAEHGGILYNQGKRMFVYTEEESKLKIQQIIGEYLNHRRSVSFNFSDIQGDPRTSEAIIHCRGYLRQVTVGEDGTLELENPVIAERFMPPHLRKLGVEKAKVETNGSCRIICETCPDLIQAA